jgi:hypothetical protein
VPRYSEAEAREAIAESLNWSAALRKLGYCPTGGNTVTLKKYAAEWRISTDHFDPYASLRAIRLRNPIPLEQVLVEGSTYSRGHLKERLFREGLKTRSCDLCGQGEVWRGKRMSLILDHVNGVRDDHRLENLRIVCPNCAATLDTHCGRNLPRIRECVRCGRQFEPKDRRQRHCSFACGSRWVGRKGRANPKLRRVERPPYEQLLREIEATSYLAVGRRYGVSDGAVRKWVRQYERERVRENDAIHGVEQG